MALEATTAPVRLDGDGGGSVELPDPTAGIPGHLRALGVRINASVHGTEASFMDGTGPVRQAHRAFRSEDEVDGTLRLIGPPTTTLVVIFRPVLYYKEH